MPTTYEIRGHTLHVLRRGAGEPLLLIQGMSGTHLSWGEPFLTDLERDFDVISYDHRGVGLSDRVSEPFSIGDLAEDAAGVLDALGLESAHVMGISMGGMVAQELALRHPERIRTLTIGCSYSGGPGSMLTDEGVVQQLGEAMLSGDRERAIRTGFEVNVSPGYGADHSNFAVFFEMAQTFPAPVAVIMLQAQAIQGHDTSARLGEIDIPTLVVHGSEDKMLDVANGRMIASRIPGARLEVLEGVGHMFWWEQPERTAALVREHTRVGAASIPQ
jgi:pimeloyl-ACP methyl ester carboxylesterase